MCGVLGIALRDVTSEDCDLVRNLFLQSMIRGKHATGVSYVKNDKVVTIKEPVPADQFLADKDIWDWVNEDGNLYCIGHVRYSTSDLRYNQPMATDELSIVHNGVISQEPPETWEETYGYKTETANDSELILRAIETGHNPLIKFHPASMAVCKIDKDKVISAFRNEARPLYRTYIQNKGYLFASTEDIIHRSGIEGIINKMHMYEVYTVTPDRNSFKFNNMIFNHNKVEDLQ